MSHRLQLIREAVARDGGKNCENAYADRAWLLSELDASREYAKHLADALQAITDHFAAVMGGPMLRGVTFENGVEGIPTIKAARAALNREPSVVIDNKGAGSALLPAVPEGWKLVPIEPTNQMREAAEAVRMPSDLTTCSWVEFYAALSEIYRAMLAAAPANRARDSENGDESSTCANEKALANYPEFPDSSTKSAGLAVNTEPDDYQPSGHLYYFPSNWGPGYVVRNEGGTWNGHGPQFSQPYYTRKSETPKFDDLQGAESVTGLRSDG